MSGKKRSGGINILNILSIMVILLACAAGAVFAMLFINPDLAANTPLAGLTDRGEAAATAVDNRPTTAAVAILPTLTPSPTGNPLAPTWTPEIAGQADTPTPKPFATSKPSSTPSITPVLPSKTPTRTPTPTPSDTPTATPFGPTITPSPTRSQFQFTKTDNSPFYLQNYANSAGCDWMGLAGEVLDLNRSPVVSGMYQVHVWGSGVDERARVGGAPAYSPSGWEQFVLDEPAVRDYNVQLETVSGTPVSQVYFVQSRNSCNQNLVRIDFIQNH